MLLREIKFNNENNTNYEKILTVKDLMSSLENEKNYDNYREFYSSVLPNIINGLVSSSNAIEDINQNNTLKTLLNVIKKALSDTRIEEDDEEEVKISLEKNFKRIIRGIIN